MVATKDLTNVLDGGGGDSAVWVAPVGTTAPTTLADPGVGFNAVGWLSAQGISFGRSEERQTFRGHQGGTVTKRRVTSVDDSFKFQGTETNLITYGLLYKGQTPTVTAGVAKITVTDQAKADNRAWVIDEYLDDGVSMIRYVIPLGSAELTAEVSWTHDGETVYEFTVHVTGDYDVYTNAPDLIA